MGQTAVGESYRWERTGDSLRRHLTIRGGIAEESPAPLSAQGVDSRTSQRRHRGMQLSMDLHTDRCIAGEVKVPSNG